jgi:hypothetical protein
VSLVAELASSLQDENEEARAEDWEKDIVDSAINRATDGIHRETGTG